MAKKKKKASTSKAKKAAKKAKKAADQAVDAIDATVQNGVAPKTRSCSVLSHHFWLLDKFPQFRPNQARLEQLTQLSLREGTASRRVGVKKIQVVVHIVYKTNAEKIGDAQIKSQIAALNKDYRATNPDVASVPAPFKPLVADASIEFALATQDPHGNATTGITRTATTRSSFSDDDAVKASATGGIEPWDTKRYLNIWVCTLGGDLLGYAQFPGGPPATDGVVILNTAFGTNGTAAAPFNLGRTTTHEVGHYLNLSHIWGEARIPTCTDSDFVADTPNQFVPNKGKPTFPHVSCNNAPDGDMFMNYMDYVDDNSMFMFTAGQVARMSACLQHERTGL
jgi:hypothetical protein